MKIKTYILIIISLFLSYTLFAQNSYEILFNSDYFEFGPNIINLDNGEQIALICKAPTTNYICNGYLYKISINGDTLLWDNQKQDTVIYYNDVIQDKDGNIVLEGEGSQLDSLGNQFNEFKYYVKMDLNFEIIWEKYFHFQCDESWTMNFKLLQLKNGDYLTAETDFYSSLRSRCLYLFSFSSEGDSLFFKKFTKKLSGKVQSLTYNYDSTKILLHSALGQKPGCGSETEGAFVLDTINYEIQKSICYSEDLSVRESFDAMLQNNGNLVVSGTARLLNSQLFVLENYLFTFIYDTAYNLIKKSYLTNKDTIINAGLNKNLDINKQGEIITTGYFYTGGGFFPQEYNYMYIAKYNENLDLLYEKYLGGDANYKVYSITATNDGGAAIIGDRYDYLVNGRESDAFIIKFKADLSVNIPNEFKTPIHNAIVYPNPGKEYLKIRTAIKNSDFKLFDINGVLVYKTKITDILTNINTSNLKNGVYIWEISNENKISEKGNWIKIK